jgi:hypothetical protein
MDNIENMDEYTSLIKKVIEQNDIIITLLKKQEKKDDTEGNEIIDSIRGQYIIQIQRNKNEFDHRNMKTVMIIVDFIFEFAKKFKCHYMMKEAYNSFKYKDWINYDYSILSNFKYMILNTSIKTGGCDMRQYVVNFFHDCNVRYPCIRDLKVYEDLDVWPIHITKEEIIYKVFSIIFISHL